MCIPVGYTRPCLPKAQQGSVVWEDTRLTEQLLGPLGFCRRRTLQEIVDYLTPGAAEHCKVSF